MSDTSTAHPLLLEADNVTLAFGDTTVFSALNLTLRRNGHLALLGPNGAGKSTLFRFLQGDIRPVQNLPYSIVYYFEEQPDSSPLSAKKHVRLVSPAQQRNYVRQGWKISGEEIILSGLDNATLLYGEPAEPEYRRAAALAEAAGAEPLLGMYAPAMSQGQLRLCLILRALISRPNLLLLDEPFDGLDGPSRRAVTSAMELAAGQACTLLVSAHRREDIPAFITEALVVDHGLLRHEPVENLLPDAWAVERAMPSPRPASKYDVQPGKSTNVPPATGRDVADKTRSECAQDRCAHIPERPPERTEKPLDRVAQPLHHAERFGHPEPFLRALAECSAPLLELAHVDVFIERKQVLHDICWTVQKGEQWIISGRNGSGKSTLLRLLYGEEFAAYGGNLLWCGEPRPGLDALRIGVGYVSDRLQDVYDYDLTAEEVVVSGLRGHIGLYEEVDAASREVAHYWLAQMEMDRQAKTPFFSLSSGMARRVLLARALAGSPPVLLLDEPCSGLDTASRTLFFAALGLLAAQGVSLFYVSHHQEDRLELFTHELILEKGRIVSAGPLTP